MRNPPILSLAISGISLALAGVHLIFPALRVDFVTVAFLTIAAMPWLAPILRSLQLPGGFIIEWQDVRAATEKVVAALGPPAAPGSPVPPQHSVPLVAPSSATGVDSIAVLQALAAEAPGLALVGLRIEIERRLRAIAHAAGLAASFSSTAVLLRELVSTGHISDSAAGGLQELVALGNSAAHGVSVTPAAASWSLDMAPTILGDLDKRLACAICKRPITLDDEVAQDKGGQYYHKACVRAQPAT
jgi:hypothetical protein